MSVPTQSTFKRELQSVDPSVFEQFVADVWDARGWNTRVTRDSTDRGVDIVATQQSPFRQKQIIQAKRYSDSNPVGSPEVQQYASLRQQEDADAVIIATSGRFSKQAKSVARDLNVKLVDGDDLYNLISSDELSSITDEYLDSDDGHSSQSVSKTAPASSASTDSEPIHTLPPTADSDNNDSVAQRRPQTPEQTTIVPSENEPVIRWLFKKRTGLMRGTTGIFIWGLILIIVLILVL